LRAVRCRAMDEQLDEQGERPAEPPPAAPTSRAGLLAVTLGVVVAAVICGIAWTDARSDARGGWATTCAEWVDKNADGQLAQALDMLTSLRAVDGLAAPDTSKAQQFSAGVSNVCSANSGWELSEVAAGLYVTERAKFG
jgi:hypothetical protein